MENACSSARKWPILLFSILLGLSNWLIPSVKAWPQDVRLRESYSDDSTAIYDDMDMPIRPESSQNVKLSGGGAKSGSSSAGTAAAASPFKPNTGHVPGGLPMISDSAFSLTILIYVSVAFLLVFFLFCWKTNGSGNAEDGNLKQQCPLMTNRIPEPKVIPPTPTPTCEA